MNFSCGKLLVCKIFLILIILSGLEAILACQAEALQDPYLFTEERLQLPDAPPLDDTKLEMFVDRSNNLYILDLRANLLYKMDEVSRKITEIKMRFPESSLTQEASLWVEDGTIYIKLLSETSIWEFDAQGNLKQKIELETKNKSTIQFVDLAVDPRGYIYTIEETSGKVEVFDNSGRFKGILAGIGGRYEDLRGIPQSLSVDDEGFIYVVSLLPGANNSEIVKYSYQGLIEQRYSEYPSCLYSNICVDKLGNIFAIDRTNGAVVKFDRRGGTICRFRVKYVRALTVDRHGEVYLDTGQGGTLISMLPSETIRLVDQGNDAFLDKHWPRAERYYKLAFKRDNEMKFIHLALGEVYYNQQDWFKAMDEFKYIKDNWRYSQSLAGFRLYVILNYWPFIIFGLLALIWMGYELSRILRNASVSRYFAVLGVIWSPRKTLLEQTESPSSVQAVLIIVLFSVTNYISWYMTNPIFIGERQVFSQQIFGWRLLAAVLLVLLWAWVSFKVGELFDGMAKTVSHMLTGTAICLIPLIVFQPFLALVSHLLSYDELWVYQSANIVLIVWVGALIIGKVGLTEDFHWEKALGVSLMSIITTALVICFIGFVLGVNQQLSSFVTDVYNEVYSRLMI